ncbi:MAG: ECF transporter S component [bacterium]|nr:ECF transporter S component [bacterium]
MRISNREIALGGLFGGIILLLGFSYLGYIPLPTPAGAATIMHIPVIMAGLLLGPKFGAIAGTLFGLSAIYYFLSIAPPWVLFPARPFIGIIPPLIYWGIFGVLRKREKSFVRWVSLIVSVFLLILTLRLSYDKLGINFWFILLSVLLLLVIIFWIRSSDPKIVSLAIASFLGSLTNTVGTLGLAVIFKVFPVGTAISIGILQGIPEAILAVIICTPIVMTLERRIRG